MKRIIKLTLLFLAIATIGVKAQQQQYANILLNSNQRLKGNILTSFDSTGVLLRVDGSPLYVYFDHIKKIRLDNKKGLREQEERITPPKEHNPFKKGLYHTFGFGTLSGNGTLNPSISLMNGYKFSEKVHAGLGANFDRYDDFATVPIFVEAKYYLKKGRKKPYYFGNAGYGFTLDETPDDSQSVNYSSEGGAYWKLGMGYEIQFVGASLAFSLAFSSQMSTSQYTESGFYPYYTRMVDWTTSYWPYGNIDVSEKRTLKRLDIRMSIVF